MCTHWIATVSDTDLVAQFIGYTFLYGCMVASWIIVPYAIFTYLSINNIFNIRVRLDRLSLSMFKYGFCILYMGTNPVDGWLQGLHERPRVWVRNYGKVYILVGKIQS